ncbi:MAG: WYL domain-containing protein [Lachnospiraceae bacterium]|nr:WYL domain-containing protein [Lachnospiraceae bacterium]
MIKVYGEAVTKKMLNILILDILHKYSDEEHHLTQQEIIRKLKCEYGVEGTDRRTVRDNVQSLVDMGYGIENEGDDGYYMYERQFDDAELRLLIDSVLFSKTISDTAAKRLIKKLKSFGNVYFDTKVSHVKQTPVLNRTDNKSVLYNVSAINEAIDRKKKITFRYNRYGTDFKMHDQGKQYIMNPYQMVASNGRYYLLGNIDKYENITYYRIDKMSQVEVMDEKIKAQKDVMGIDGHLNLPKHMAEHIYMLYGDSVVASIKTDIGMMDTLVDWFGKDFRIIKKEGEEVVISVKCNERALFYWALQYGPHLEVLGPESLRSKLSEAVEEMAKKYRK